MSRTIKISFCGDVMCLKEQLAAISRVEDRQSAFNSIFEGARPLLADSDYVVGNLETPICDAEFSSESISFNAPSEFARACRAIGFDFLTTANNHCLDRGIDGIDQTIANLDMIGISHTGTYAEKENSNEICIVDVRGKKVALIAATFGTNSEVNGVLLPEDQLWRVDLFKKQNKPAKARFNPSGEEGRKIIYDNVSSAAIGSGLNRKYVDRILDKIQRAKKKSDIVIVLPHIGGQYNPVPGKYTRHIVSEIASVKPSLIVANHPHVPLRMEKVNGVWSAFSLGNFSFTPGVGYFIPNVLAEYGIIFHTYWNQDTAELEKLTFSIVSNHIGEDGISRVMPVSDLCCLQPSTIDRERILFDAEAVATRVSSRPIDNPLSAEIELQ